MESILEHLSNPESLFYTALVGIIFSVIAGFLKDWISQLIGHLSRRLRGWSQQRKEKQEHLVESLSENPDYLLMGLGKVLLRTIMFTGTIIIYLLLPIYSEFKHPSSNPELNSMLKTVLSVAVYPFFGGISMVFGFRATSGLNVIAKSIKKYREKNGLPKLP